MPSILPRTKVAVVVPSLQNWHPSDAAHIAKSKILAVSRSLPIKDQASLESEDMFEDMILTSITLQKQIQSPKGLNLDFPKPFNRTMDWLQKDSKVAIEIFGRPFLPQQVRVRAYRSVSDTLLAL
jgi:hypothetical protein